jgi:hypothetical protein
MQTPQPCPACQEQLSKKRRDSAHLKLEVLEVRPVPGSLFGGRGWEETTYKCRTCGARIEHTTDKNDFARFWWFVPDRPR